MLPKSRQMRKCKGSYRKPNKYALATKKYVDRSVRKHTEAKRTSHDISQALITGTLFDVLLLANASGGGGENNRLGNQVQLLSTQFRIIVNSVNTTKTWFLRYACVKYLTTEARTTKIFQDAGNFPVDFGTGGDVHRIIYPLNKRRIEVLYDKTLKISSDNSSDGNDMIREISPLIKINEEVKFEAAGNPSDGVINPRHHWIWWMECEDPSETAGLDTVGMINTWFTDA